MARSLVVDGAILVADPDVGDRAFIERVLRLGGFRVQPVGSGEEALAAARRARPRLVILEAHLGDVSGYEVCCALREAFGTGVPLIFVSRERAEPSDRVAGLLLGADDYLGKPLAPDELLARVRALERRTGFAGTYGTQRGNLTGRELEVLHLLADGLDQAAIARTLFIAPKTVSKHIEHILTKLPAHSRAEAVALAYRCGLHGKSSHRESLDQGSSPILR